MLTKKSPCEKEKNRQIQTKMMSSIKRPAKSKREMNWTELNTIE